MKHNHQSKEECKHEKLIYCKECDVVECECGREWGKYKVEPITPLPYAITPNTSWYCTMCGKWVTDYLTHHCISNTNFTCSNK